LFRIPENGSTIFVKDNFNVERWLTIALLESSSELSIIVYSESRLHCSQMHIFSVYQENKLGNVVYAVVFCSYYVHVPN